MLCVDHFTPNNGDDFLQAQLQDKLCCCNSNVIYVWTMVVLSSTQTGSCQQHWTISLLSAHQQLAVSLHNELPTFTLADLHLEKCYFTNSLCPKKSYFNGSLHLEKCYFKFSLHPEKFCFRLLNIQRSATLRVSTLREVLFECSV